MQEKQISFHDIFYIFLFGCLFGWVIEGIWSLLKKGLLINHSALIIGPFNIIYGLGAVCLTIFLLRFKDKNNLYIFCASFIIGTILEYTASLFMEYTLGFVAWNYSKKPFNINGRVCLLYSVFWGLIGIFWIKSIYPFIKKIIDKFNKKKSIPIMKFLIVFLIIDTILSFGAVARAKEYEKNIPPSNKLEEIYDKYFGVDYLNNMYNNRWNKK